MEYRCQYCGRKLDTGLRCPVCDAKRSENMKTPTKEQLEYIRYMEQYTTKVSKNTIKSIITEWEKIRNSPKIAKI